MPDRAVLLRHGLLKAQRYFGQHLCDAPELSQWESPENLIPDAVPTRLLRRHWAVFGLGNVT